MREIDKQYVSLLEVGFVILRQACDMKDSSWIAAEVEFLHNVPSLIGETNKERHLYFCNEEQAQYRESIAKTANPVAISRWGTYYGPILQKLSNCLAESI
jgi:hypothetical protein